MAKKSKAEEAAGMLGGIIGAVLVVAAVCVLVCVALAPLFLLIASIYYQVKFRRMKVRLRNDLSDFWLTEGEIEDFRNNSTARDEDAEAIVEARIKAVEEKIPKNRDGRYSIRRKVGKDVRATLENCRQDKIEREASLEALRTKPLKRWEKFNYMACRSKAFRGALIAWLAIAAFFLSSAYWKGTLEPSPGTIASFLEGSQTIGLILGSLAGSTLTLLVLMVVFRNYGSRFSPKPPEVTLSNLELPSKATAQKVSVSLVPPVQSSLPVPRQLESQTATFPPPIRAAIPLIPANAPPMPSQRTSRAAIASLVLGIVGAIFPLFVVPILATVFAIVGLRNTRDGRTAGKGMAIAGLTLGAIGIIFSILLVISMRTPDRHG